MARPRRTNEQLIQHAQETVRHTQDAVQLRQALAVLLPAQLHTTLEQTARILGVGRDTVPRLQARFQRPMRDCGSRFYSDRCRSEATLRVHR